MFDRYLQWVQREVEAGRMSDKEAQSLEWRLQDSHTDMRRTLHRLDHELIQLRKQVAGLWFVALIAILLSVAGLL